MTVKKGDFVELEYTARTADDGQVYDTTIKEEAEKAGLTHDHEHGDEHHHHENEYNPIKICVGEKHVLPGLDKKLEGLSPGKHEVKLSVEEAYGKKNPKQLKLIPMAVFKKQNIQPQPGLQLNIDNQIGTVRNVSGGRVIVDFNHPLSGKEVIYNINIKRKVEDKEEQVKAILELLNIPYEKAGVEDKKAVITLSQNVPEQYTNMLKEDIKRTAGVEAEFKSKEEKPKENKKSGGE